MKNSPRPNPRVVAPLIEGVELGGLLADKAFDSNTIIAELHQRGAKIAISSIPGAHNHASSTRKSTSGVTISAAVINSR